MENSHEKVIPWNSIVNAKYFLFSLLLIDGKVKAVTISILFLFHLNHDR